MTRLYKGFSTKTFIKPDSKTITGLSDNFFGPYNLSDKNLIIMDILNHFHIRRGEKLMNPKFGTIIWERLFEPMTTALKSELVNDVNAIIKYDPRVSMIDRVNLTESNDGHGLIIEVSFVLKSTNELVAINMKFDGTTGIMTPTIAS